MLNPLSVKEQQQAVFLHHALWNFSRNLPPTNTELHTAISVLRSQMEKSGCFKGISEDLYCSYVTKGGIDVLKDIC